MTRIPVDGFDFSFPEGWTASKYDEWSFYREQFVKIRNGIKAIDILAVDPDRVAWLIEVKDYSVNPRTKPSDLCDEVAQKVLDTLAALLPAHLNAPVPHEKHLADAVLRTRKVRVVLHLEQPKKHSRLRPRAINPADVQQSLRLRLKPIDAHPKVTELATMRGMPWQVK
jgi:hypothetical protein